MAVCILNKDLKRSETCGYSLNEVAKIFLANFEDVIATTPGECTGGGVQVADITMAEGKKWYEVNPAKNSASFSDALVAEDNGAKYRVHTLNFSFNGAFDCEMPDVIDALSLGKFIAVVQYASGEWIMLGRVMGLEADSDGANFGGENSAGITVVLSGNQAESAMPLSEAAVKKVTGAN